MIVRMFAAAALFLAAAPAYAQYQTDQLERHADVVRQGILVDKTVNRNRNGAARQGISPKSQAICASKHRMAARLGRSHPRVRRLYGLCAQAGY